MAGLRKFTNEPLSAVPSAIRSGQTDAQLNIGFIDVTKPPYNCDKTGLVNCTTGFQQALDDGYAYNFSVWVPKGTYLLTRLLFYQLLNYKNAGASNMKHAMQLFGDTTGGNYPTLKAAPGLGTVAGSDVTDTSHAGVFISLYFNNESATTQALRDDPDYDRIYTSVIRGFNIDMGNNPGAAAMAWPGAQLCNVEDVNIFGTAFRYGIHGLPGSGGSMTNIKVTGGQTGLNMPLYRPSPSVHNVELINQTSEGLFVGSARGSVILVGFKIVGSGAGYSAVRINSATIFGQPSRNLVLVDGSLDLSGGATVAVSCNNSHVYLRNVWARAATIVRQSSTNTTLAGVAGQWVRVREYAYSASQASSPIWVDGQNLGGANVAYNGGVEAAGDPPASWQAIHGWDATTFPTYWNSTPNLVDVRSHGAVAADADDPAGTDNAAALNAAFAAAVAAGRPALLPRGFFYCRGPVTFPAGLVLLGTSFTNCVINASRHWQPGALTDLVRTADAVGNLTISDVCINGHEGSATQGIEAHKFITLFHCRTSNLLARDLHVNRREWFSGGNAHFQAPAVKFTGNAGGRFYNLGAFFFHGSTASMHADYRHVLISGTSKPLAIYQPDCEGAGSNPQCEILNAQNITFYGFKHEPGIGLINIVGSDNIAILGGSGNYSIGSDAMYDVNTSDNVVVAVIARQLASNTAPVLREDGTIRVAADRTMISLFKKGEVIPYGELVQAPATTPQVLGTGLTLALAPGNLLLIAVLGARNATGSDASELGWTAPVANSFFLNAGGDGRSVGTGFGQVATGGTKEATATWRNSGAAAPAIAGLLAFQVQDV